MKNIDLKLRKVLRILFGSISFTTMAFIFQACYGMPFDRYQDVLITGTVRSKTTNLPVKGIKVMVNDEEHNYGITDENGKFNFYSSVPNYSYEKDNVLYSPDKVSIHFFDIDGIENGCFADTTIIVNPARKDEVKINVELKEKACE